MDRIRADHSIADTDRGGTVVSVDRQLAWRTAVLSALLLWPLILFGRPGYIADSAAYIKGGKVAVEFVTDKFETATVPAPTVEVPVSGQADATASGAETAAVKGARSIPYSVMAYLFRGLGFDMTWLAVVQAVLAAFVCAVGAAAAGVKSPRSYLALGVGLALGSSLPTFATFALPDVFAGIVAASLILLFAGLEKLSRGIRLALVAIASLAVAVHASIAPLALWLCIAGTAYALWRRRGMGQPLSRVAWLWTPMAIGGIVTVAAGFIAFGEASVAAKHYPHALARSVSDGPARWYLEEECRTPRYAVCEVFGTNIPTTVSGFLFNETGLDGRATPEQMDRIRAEEGEIVLRAALAYPGTELGNFAGHVAKQFVVLGIWPGRFGDRIRSDAAGNPEFVEMPDRLSIAIIALDASAYAVMAFCLLWVAFNFRRLGQEQRLILGLILSVLVVNAAFCVLASGISDRYQARLAWIVPLFVLGMILSKAGFGRFFLPGSATDADPEPETAG